MSTLHLGEQATSVAGDHGVEVVDRRVHVHGAHAIDITVGCGKGLDALLEFTGQIHSDLRFDMTIGQPSETAPMNLESGRSIEWVSVSFADAPVGSIS